jgi:antigen 43
VASATEIESGGIESIAAGGTDAGAQISGGTQLDFGLASGATIIAGSQVVEAGGSASGTIVSGGTLDVLASGVASLAAIDSGGTEVVSAGGTDLGAQISGGEQDVFGLASGAAISAGLQVVEVAGTASTTVVGLGGQDVSGLRSAPSSAAAARSWRLPARRAVRRSFSVRWRLSGLAEWIWAQTSAAARNSTSG